MKSYSERAVATAREIWRRNGDTRHALELIRAFTTEAREELRLEVLVGRMAERDGFHGRGSDPAFYAWLDNVLDDFHARNCKHGDPDAARRGGSEFLCADCRSNCCEGCAFPIDYQPRRPEPKFRNHPRWR